jgi:hypothetical protein
VVAKRFIDGLHHAWDPWHHVSLPICVQRDFPWQGGMLAQGSRVRRFHLNAKLALFRFAKFDHALLAVIIVVRVIFVILVLRFGLLIAMRLMIPIFLILVTFLIVGLLIPMALMIIIFVTVLGALTKLVITMVLMILL